MNNGNGIENGMGLDRLFSELPEPGKGEAFIRRVLRRIALRRYTKRLLLILLAGLGIAILSALTPWLMRETGHIVIGVLSAASVVAVTISRIGWVLGLVVVIFVLVKSR